MKWKEKKEQIIRFQRAVHLNFVHSSFFSFCVWIIKNSGGIECSVFVCALIHSLSSSFLIFLCWFGFSSSLFSVLVRWLAPLCLGHLEQMCANGNAINTDSGYGTGKGSKSGTSSNSQNRIMSSDSALFTTRNNTKVIAQRGGLAVLPCAVKWNPTATVSFMKRKLIHKHTTPSKCKKKGKKTKNYDTNNNNKQEKKTRRKYI